MKYVLCSSYSPVANSYPSVPSEIQIVLSIVAIEDEPSALAVFRDTVNEDNISTFWDVKDKTPSVRSNDASFIVGTTYKSYVLSLVDTSLSRYTSPSPIALTVQ